MASGPISLVNLPPTPLHRLHYLVTLLEPSPAVWDIEAIPEDGGWCVTVTPLDGSPPWDAFITLPHGMFLRFLSKVVEALS